MTRLTTQQAELNKRIETITTTNKENLEKFQKANQELLGKNKQINEMQAINRDKVTEVSKLNARVKELESEWNRAKKEKEEASKLLVVQQDINSKNLGTIKELKEIITKKEEMLKEAQKELKSL